MKEEDLINKLENVELPEVELPSHKSRLKMALLKERHDAGVAELVRTKIKGGIYIMRGILMSKQPVWKSIVAGVLALALITGLAITLVGTGQSAAAMAVDIAKNSPQVKAALGGGIVQEVESLKVTDGKGTVIVRGEPSPANAFAVPEVIVEVDIKTKQVTAIIPMQEFTSADEQKAVNIAKNHPEVKNLLNEGAVIVKVFPLFEAVTIEGNTSESKELCALSALVVIELGEKKWAAQVDLLSEKVTNLGETTFAAAQPAQAPSVK